MKKMESLARSGARSAFEPSFVRSVIAALCKLLFPLAFAMALIHLEPSSADGAAITVNANQLVTNTIAGSPTAATVANIGIGMNTSVYYNNINASYISPALDTGGVSIIRYPGGNYSDIYHWTSNVATGGFAATNSNFASFAQSILLSPADCRSKAWSRSTTGRA